METKIFKTDDNSINEVGRILKNGGLAAFPTETVYGLGANALLEDSVKKIYAAKGRPSDNPLILHIAEKEQLKGLVKEIPKKAECLIEAFWPGPMTLIFEKTEAVPYGTTGGLETVAIRMPNHPVALALIRAAGLPIAAPSANISGRPSPTMAEHVKEDMDGKIDLILDGGKVALGIESTIVDMTVEPPMILRPGFITKEMLEEQIGEVAVDRVVTAKAVSEIKKDEYTPKAPGMKYKHYAPKADLTMYEGSKDHVIAAILKRKEEEEKKGRKVGILCTEETKDCYPGQNIIPIGSREREETIASNLYQVLRQFDETDADVILGESFYGGGLGQAIMNRLIKAAGYQLVNADEHVDEIK